MHGQLSFLISSKYIAIILFKGTSTKLLIICSCDKSRWDYVCGSFKNLANDKYLSIYDIISVLNFSVDLYTDHH